jgi:hypothetical protein
MIDGPGPLELLSQTALVPFPMMRSFEGIVAVHLDGIRGADGALVGAKTDASSDPPLDLESTFNATIGAARDAAANEDATTPSSPVPDILGAGDNNDGTRLAMLKYLPDRGAPIEQTFDPPPDAPSSITEPGPPPEPPPVK